MLRRALLAVLTLLLTLPALALTSPASAATSAPTGLTANSTDALTIPTLSWGRVPDATSYEVQVATSSGFSPTVWTGTTVNLNAVPTKQLPTGELWFRVRATGPGGSSDWSVLTFDRAKADGPGLTFPADGAVLRQPDDPVLLTWTAVQGATEYVIEISSDRGFTDPSLIKSYKTKTTTLVRPDSQDARPYYWRVAGVLATGVTTHWSEVRSYVLASLPAAQLVSPANGSAVTVDDVVLDWRPVPGAKSYDVEISLVPDFSTVVGTQTGVVGTRYSPPITLDNNQYYWRVRARDVFGNLQNADDVSRWTFRRAWSEQPQLQYPPDGATVGAPFYFQWSPVKLASRYRLEITDSFGVTRTCLTAQTTWTTRSRLQPQQDCWPSAGGTYTWRVIALDDPASPAVQTDSIGAEVREFSYHPGLVQPLLPAEGAEVSVPTLRWSPHAGAAEYRVTLTNTGTGATTTIDTRTTSFTPRTALLTGNYRWSVQWISEDGRYGPTISPGDQRTFQLVDPAPASAPTPEPTLAPAVHDRFPTLTWTPVAGATHYKLLVRRTNAISNTVLMPKFSYPAGEDETERFQPAGDYVWRVEAWNDGVYLSTSQAQGQFTVAERRAVTGQRAALSGTETGDPLTSCALTAPDTCEGVRNTPVLRWDAEPNTAFYEVYLSYDRELTNLVGKNDGFPIKFPQVVHNTMYTPPTALPEGDAGTAYYWSVRPCASDDVCRPLEYPNHSFSKLSTAARPLSPGLPLADATPANLPSLPDDITFTWEDYLQTARDGDTSGSTLKTVARSEAQEYRIQVSDDPQFNNLLDNQVVDQTTFTSFANTYPDTQLYWRVQAIDGSDNPLPWSRKWTFDKQSPVPVPLEPVGDSDSSGQPYDGSTPIRWEPLDYAASYDVEVYRNGDTKPDAANLVDKGNIAQTAVNWSVPVEPSDSAYTWRVRRVDAKGRRGDWSAWSSYRVTAATMGTSAPAAGAVVPPTEGLFSWGPVTGAASYRWERRAPGSGTTAQVVATPATAYAPTAVLPDGPWQWRVVALDTGGKVLNSSAWRDFSVTGAPTATAAVQIEGTGSVGSTLTSLDPSWDMPDVVNHYQWLRGTFAIPDATSPTYEVTGADVGRTLSLRVTGRRPGYRDATTTSNGISGVSGPAPTTATAPRIEGSGRVGEELTATPPTWNEQGVSETYAWLRNGSVIGGQTGTTYVLTTGDADRDISFRVTGTKPGYANAVVVSNVIRAVPGTAPENATPPTLSGDPVVGQSMQVLPGTWSPDVTYTYRYQWLRDGVPVTNATGTFYRLTASDAGREVSATVYARRTGYADGEATTDAVSIPRVSSTTTGTPTPSTIKRSVRGKVSVYVSAPGVTGPTGKVRVKKRAKTLASGKLTTAKNGRVTVRLPRLPKGRHRLTVKYTGDQQVAPSKSGRVTLTVTR